MLNLQGFLIAQGIAWSLFGLWKWADKPKKLPVKQPVVHKFVMPTIELAYARIAQQVRVRYERIPLTQKQRFEILKRDNFICQYCGRKPPEVTLEVDHKISVYNGGSNHPTNLISSCLDCNRGKGAKSVRMAS